MPKGSYYLYIKDIEESLKIRTDYLYTRASGYKALNIYTIDTPNNQYKISYFNNPLDNIPYPKGTTFLTTPNTPIPTYHTDERVKIFLKGSKTYKDFILKLKQKIDSIQSQYEIERVRLEVGYDTGEMVLEIVRKWEYSPNNEDFKYWATISEFSLKLDGEIIKDSDNKEIKGYIVEPAGMNPTINKTAEEQQKTAGGDIRIPVGEYEVFWKYSDISKPALMIENPNNKEIYLNDLRQTIKNLDINIEQLYCNTTTCKHNQVNRKTFGTKHIHIVPQLKPKNTNTTIIGKSRDGILIHYGDTGEWSTGCLLPTTELRWKKERWIAKDRDSTINAIARLYIAIIKHDREAFKNYILGANNFTKSTIKKFIVRIKEQDKIESYPPSKEK